MLQIKDLKLLHDKDFRVLIDSLSFTVNPGDKIVIIGEEGEGKSTLLKWIFDPSMILHYAEAEGERVIKGERLGYLPQELSAGELQQSVYDFMNSEPCFQDTDPAQLSKTANMVGIDPGTFFEDRKMHTLSGGEKVKLQLARILLSQPTVILLDEPSNDIDIETLEWLERFINGFRGGILFVSHDETLIERTANRVIHIEQLSHKTLPRHTVANIPYREYMQQRLHGFALQEMQARQDRRQQRIAEEKWRKIYQRVEHEQNVISRADPSGGRLLKKKMHAVKSQGRRLEKQRENMTEDPRFEHEIKLMFDYDPSPYNGRELLNVRIPMLTAGGKFVNELADNAALTVQLGITPAENANPEVPSGRILAENIELKVLPGEKICITGKNGTGKTTLLKEIKSAIEQRPNIHCAYMPQNYEELLDPELTPVEFLCKSGDKEEKVLINNRLSSLRFTPDDIKRKISELSGGQKAKLLLLSLTLSGAYVLLLDEPTRNFSPLSGPVIREMLAGFAGTIISVSHDRKYIEDVADKVYRLEKTGLYKLPRDRWSSFYELKQPAPAHYAAQRKGPL